MEGECSCAALIRVELITLSGKLWPQRFVVRGAIPIFNELKQALYAKTLSPRPAILLPAVYSRDDSGQLTPDVPAL